MTDDTPLTDVEGVAATTWVERLTARGVTLQARGKNVGFSPKSAYNGALTNAERAFYKAHKAEIVAALRERYSGTAGPPVQVATLTLSEGVASTLASAPESCRWCGRSPCIGPEHDAYFDLHPDAAQQREAEHATREMNESLRRFGALARY